jgi:ABC-type transport system involved in multi-copper enzyme maturation permease subunit
VSGILFRRTVAAWRGRLLAVGVGLALWGFTLPVIFATFGADFRQLIESGSFGELFEAFAAFGGGSIFTLGGSVALGFIHPIPIVLVAVFALGYPAAALAGERQRGTLEVLLARPLSRRRVYLTTLAATILFVVAAVAADVAGVVAGAALFDVIDELAADRLALAAANAALLFAALGAIALAASASFDRLGPALGLPVAFAVVSYAVEFLGAVWPELAWLRPWSIFNHFQPGEIIDGVGDPADVLVLASVFVLATAYGLWRFPRRDLAAPS